jgi:DNA polymerase-3 subunit delta'
MTWQGIEGHDDVVARLRGVLSRERLASTLLFVGPPGVGKYSFALKFGQTLLCSERLEGLLDPCGNCLSCRQSLAGTHPDLLVVCRPADKSVIPVETFIGDRDHRMSAGLCHDISLKPFMGRRRVAIIDDADYLHEESANCLLKTLEEPPPRSVLILIGTSIQRQLPTIRSRCQIVRFAPLDESTLTRLIQQRLGVSDSAHAREISHFAEGSLTRAAQATDAATWQFRGEFMSHLARRESDPIRLAEMVTAFVDSAGSEASARRDRLRMVIGFALDFYRQWLRAANGSVPRGDAELLKAIDAAQAGCAASAELASARLERSLDALTHVDRNANQATIVQCWLEDVAETTLLRPEDVRS